MNDFFRSKTFKIIAVLLAAVLAFFLRAVYTGGDRKSVGRERV